MTKLEEEINKAIEAVAVPVYDVWNTKVDTDIDPKSAAKAGAEVTKRYIEKAIYDLAGFVVTKDELEKWSKDNGVI